MLQIAAELRLHHITVKNFFSNGRRRLRRAAARINDPERTKRENLRRKEKRKLAAMAQAAAKENNSTITPHVSSPEPVAEPVVKETTVLSPQRRALMEKLADKVHRSAAQKSRITLMNESSPMNLTPPYEEKVPIYDAQLQHITQAAVHTVQHSNQQQQIQPMFTEVSSTTSLSNQQQLLEPISPFVEPYNSLSMDTSPTKFTFDSLIKSDNISLNSFSSLIDDPLTQLTCENPFPLSTSDSLLSLAPPDSPLSSSNWASTLLS